MTQPDFEERRNRRQPETLRLRAVVPALTVSNLQASLSWYCDVLGFTLAETWERDGVPAGVSLVAGSERIVLVQDDGAKGERVKGAGLRFYLKTVQDIDMLAEGVRARGGVLESGPYDGPAESRAFTMLDPDGFRLTITSHG